MKCEHIENTGYYFRVIMILCKNYKYGQESLSSGSFLRSKIPI